MKKTKIQLIIILCAIFPVTALAFSGDYMGLTPNSSPVHRTHLNVISEQLDMESPTATQSLAILVVDDDNNIPDVQAYYTDALDGLGLAYDVWDTNGTDNEPSAEELDAYTTVVWFTGANYTVFAGPGPASETALGGFLDDGNCFFISGQDYNWDSDPTVFMTTYLGVGSVTEDITSTVVEGVGSVFGGLGPYTLSFPPDFYNFSDQVAPDSTANVAFNGNQGSAAISKDRNGYRTTYWGFPFEAIPTLPHRQNAIDAYLEWCGSGKPGAAENVRASDGTFTDKVRITWDRSSGANTYQVYKAVTSTGKKIPLGSTSSTTFDVNNAPINDHYYWVKACNSTGCSAYSDPDTGWLNGTAAILVVDDDDNEPDFLPDYTSTLDALGLPYNIWDTGNSDNEPDDSRLAPHSSVIWFSGYEFGLFEPGFAGPGAAGETALAAFLDNGNCFFISSMEYYNDKNYTLTPFMTSYLGVSSVIADGFQDTVTGTGSVFSGLGPYSLDYYDEFADTSDHITNDGTAEQAYIGDYGNLNAAVNKENGAYRTTYWGFPFEALPNTSAKQDTMNAFLSWCNADRPAAPTGVQASDGTFEDKVRVTWDESSGATSYVVFRKDTDSGYIARLDSSAGTTFDDMTAQNRHIYDYWVKACTGTHCSGLSEPDTGFVIWPEELYLPLILSEGSG